MSAELIPRHYQTEVFAQAQKRNIIAALDTGSGKTFISTLLIKWIAAQPSSYRKSVVFLVPKVALAEQQADFIAKHSSFRVLKVYGAMEIDVSDRAGWEKKFAQHDVIVITPQVFYNLITHSVWQIAKVSLLVFDECHHARKNHPYNMIMREYKRCAGKSRPKIFGMTASPILNPNQAEKSLKELEANMDSTIIGVTNTTELSENSPKPDESVRVYPPPPLHPTCHVSSLYASLAVFPFIKSMEEWDVIERRYSVTLFNLGPFAAAMYFHHEMWTRIRALIIQSTGWCDGEEALVLTAKVQSLSDDYYHVAEILLEFQSFFSPDCEVLLEWCSPKLGVLVETILAHHSDTFQGIIFVEQRQTAACLARILPNLSELKGLVRCADLVGKSTNSEGVSNVRGGVTNKEAMQAFRSKKVNLLIATAVAEEGLDFPACDLVIRFDKVQHLVGYVQSRGRARNKVASTFIVMVQNDETEYLKKLSTLSSSEPALKSLYQTKAETVSRKVEEDDDDGDNPEDMQARERYVVPRTGAFVTYDNAIALIGHLCSLIPVDKYTSPQMPVFTDDHHSRLTLPACLPLPPEDLVFKGPSRHSKKEAKRAVAFMAVVRLHELDVLDDYLLPVSNKKGKGNEDLEGRPLLRLTAVPNIMDVVVRDPWTMGTALWMHAVYIDGHAAGGLITGTSFPPVSVRSYASMAEVRSSTRIELTDDESWVMDRFTRLMVWHVNTAKDITSPMSVYLVPLTDQDEPDFVAMKRLLSNPYGSKDWARVTEAHNDRCMVVNANQHGRPYIFRRLRDDLTPMSPLPPDMNSPFSTYYDYWVDRWTRKKWQPIIPRDGPLIEVSRLPRFDAGKYPLDPSITVSPASFSPILLPLGCCSWLNVPWDVLRAYRALPHLARRLTDVYRARAARFELGLPPVMDDLLVQALTIPGAGASFNNQRLETLGDAVLELCTTVHLFNTYPHRHEGQLDVMRQNCISNRFLMTRALEIGLEHFVTGESQSVRTWRYVVGASGRCAGRETPRRSLQDCMEATLGAAFVTGGIPMALRAGAALGMSMGGVESWYGRRPRTPVAPMFWQIEHDLGYKFRDGRLLAQALTHPSFTSAEFSVSYQRLEFLGDALLDIVVVDYLYKRFPQASSQQLHMPKATVVCASALAFLAIKYLRAHTVALINNVELSMAIDEAVPVLEDLSPADIITHGWKYHPPKAISDLFESVMGAVLIDSGYNYERTAEVVEYVMRDLLALVSPAVKRDPITEMHQWVAKAGCRLQPKFSSHPKGAYTGIAVSLHDVHLVGPIVSQSSATSKFVAAERGLALLRDPTKASSLQTICDCGKVVVEETVDIPGLTSTAV